MFTERELEYLEGVLNEEVLSILQSGYGLKNDSVVTGRALLKKLGLKEYYKFDKYDTEE